MQCFLCIFTLSVSLKAEFKPFEYKILQKRTCGFLLLFFNSPLITIS